MQVMDIVNRAVMNAGIVPSFNPDEVPEDIQARAADVLRNEIIPSMNCDRTLDITEVVFTLQVRSNHIDLKTTPLDYDGYIYPSVLYTAAELNKVSDLPNPPHGVLPAMTGLLKLLLEMGLVESTGGLTPYSNIILTDKWPTDQFGTPRKIAFWTDDVKFFEVEPNSWYGVTNPDFVNYEYNVPFPPMRVSEIYRATDGANLQYVHAGEFVSSEFRYSQLIFTTEDYPTKLRIKFPNNYGCATAMVVLPMPIRVVNSFEEPNPWEGEIVASDKFRSYLIAMLGWRMAVEYGVTTVDAMKGLVDVAYQALLKNPSKREHKQDISRKISNYLERGRGWRAGANGNGYAGGFNG